jgi:hypothetical protein
MRKTYLLAVSATALLFSVAPMPADEASATTTTTTKRTSSSSGGSEFDYGLLGLLGLLGLAGLAGGRGRGSDVVVDRHSRETTVDRRTDI